MISRDPMVGPWQVPVSDVAVTVSDYFSITAKPWRWASARRWRCSTPRPRAAWPWRSRSRTSSRPTSAASKTSGLSANWMAACGEPGEDADLYDTVHADRRGVLSRARHRDPGRQGFAVDEDGLGRGGRGEEGRRAGVARGLGVCAGRGRSPYAHAAAAPRSRADAAAADRPGWRSPTAWAARASRRSTAASATSRRLRRPAATARLSSARSATCAVPGLLLAYHDRSDGGLFATLVEMAFAGHCGLERAARGRRPGGRCGRAVCRGTGRRRTGRGVAFRSKCGACLPRRALADCVREIGRGDRGRPGRDRRRARASRCLQASRTELRAAWSETSYRLQAMRDNPACAEEERARTLDPQDPGPVRTPDVRSRRRYRGALRQSRRTTGGRDPARAGRQQPARNGRGVRARGVQSLPTCT